MEFNKRQIRTLSMLGQRGSFGTALLEIAEENEKIIGLSADLCNTSGMDRFAGQFPDRFINTGIAEQNMIGIAAGLADAGYIPFATTFANFISLRGCEFVRHFLSYMQCNVKLIGLSAGFGMELFGNTHYGVEDVACIRSFPNITIFSPADGVEVYKCVETAAKIQGPVYIRLVGKMNLPIIHTEDFDFETGKPIKVREGQEIVILATGSMVKRALDAADILEQQGIHAAVMDVHTLVPFSFENVKNEILGAKLAVTVEEHSIVGGLGSILSEGMAEIKDTPPLLRLGVGIGFKKAGDYDFMLEQNRLTAELIAQDIQNKYQTII